MKRGANPEDQQHLRPQEGCAALGARSGYAVKVGVQKK